MLPVRVRNFLPLRAMHVTPAAVLYTRYTLHANVVTKYKLPIPLQ